jgi:hypothetical protein
LSLAKGRWQHTLHKGNERVPICWPLAQTLQQNQALSDVIPIAFVEGHQYLRSKSVSGRDIVAKVSLPGNLLE